MYRQSTSNNLARLLRYWKAARSMQITEKMVAYDKSDRKIQYPLLPTVARQIQSQQRRRSWLVNNSSCVMLILFTGTISLLFLFFALSSQNTARRGAVTKLSLPIVLNQPTLGTQINHYPEKEMINFESRKEHPQQQQRQLPHHHPKARAPNDHLTTKREPRCEPANLVGRMAVSRSAPPMWAIEAQFSAVQIGGHFRPANCRPQDRVAIIVPYRDREKHLRIFLHHLHPMLMRQKIEYQIFLVEQAGNAPFNRGKLSNVGFLEARKHFNLDCIIIHDIDLMPEDDRNLYHCPEPQQPRHMSASIDTHSYTLLYETLFGGVSALTREQFETINGFSNVYWGWGAEDDDLSYRLSVYNYTIARYDLKIARYTMLKHEKAEPSPDRLEKYDNANLRLKTDGLNSIQYKLLNTVFHRLYTWILVDIGSPPV